MVASEEDAGAASLVWVSAATVVAAAVWVSVVADIDTENVSKGEFWFGLFILQIYRSHQLLNLIS